MSFGTSILGFFGKIGGAIVSLAGKLALGIRTLFMANPVGFIIGIIAAIVAALAYFFTQTEVGKKMWADFTKFLGEAMANGLACVITDVGSAYEFEGFDGVEIVELSFNVLEFGASLGGSAEVPGVNEEPGLRIF
jgi:hypothetical protein